MMEGNPGAGGRRGGASGAATQGGLSTRSTCGKSINLPFKKGAMWERAKPTIEMTIKTRHPDVCRNIDRTKRIIYIASMKPDASSSQSRNRLKALRGTLYYKNRRSAT